MCSSSQGDILLTDLAERIVDGKTSKVRGQGYWQVVEYELEELGYGRALMIDRNNPEPATIRLGVTGHYRISFVTRYTDVRAKLTGEKCFDTCASVSGQEWYGMARSFDAEEAAWREADLTGRDLVIDGREATYLLAIRLSPIEAPAEDKSEVRWPMAFTDDALDMSARHHRGPEELFEEDERVPQDSCVRMMIYGGVTGDNCMHFTDVGTEFGSIDEAGDPRKETHALANMNRWREWGINPAEAVVEYGHNRGWEVYFYVRPRGWGDVWPCSGPG